MSTILYRKIFWILFVFLSIAQGAYLHRVPGLLGDEASEGENVFELLDKKQITVVGERSYIGPLIDYVRIPAVLVFGYSAFGLRLVTALFSLLTFVLAVIVLRRLFGKDRALSMAMFLVFSPVYLLEQRLGWAITLMPFFAFLTLFFLTGSYRHAPLLAGLAAGLGLANHILFLPTLAGIVVGMFVYTLPRLISEPAKTAGDYARLWPSIVGFWAGFAMQAAVLILFPDDQGDPATVAEGFLDRLSALPQLLPQVLSGSSYVARYTGVEFSLGMMWGIVGVLGVLAFGGVLASLFLSSPARRSVASWMVGLAAHTVVLLYLIDRFSLRYFVVVVLGVWMLAGLGAGYLTLLLSRRARWVSAAVPLVCAGMFMLWMAVIVLVPFLRTGGSTNDFSLGNRTDSAAAHVDVQPLIACLRGAGSVFSENVHILNRLRYISHAYADLDVVTEEDAQHAQWLVHYRFPGDTVPSDLCADIVNFRIEANTSVSDDDMAMAAQNKVARVIVMPRIKPGVL